MTMLERTTIRDLVADEADRLIIAVIIFAQEPRVITSRVGDQRAVWNLTLRDSPTDTINLSVWGTAGDIHAYTDALRIGDVVEVQNPRIRPQRESDGEQDNYVPEVSSPLQLLLSVGSRNVDMVLHEAPPAELEKLQELMAIPTKPPQSFISLNDIQNTSSARSGTQLNLLVAVRSVGTTRTVKTRNNQHVIVRTISVFDQSGIANSLPMQIWNSILAERAAFWTPRETVLFVADGRLEWSSFHRGLQIKLTARSIVTENPATEEADWLRDYARNSPLNATSVLDQYASPVFDPSTVQKVMSVEAILSRCRAMERSQEAAAGEASSGHIVAESPAVAVVPEHFTALLYAAVTGFDIDGPNERGLKLACTLCQAQLENSESICPAPLCAGRVDRGIEVTYDLRVDISDHTATLSLCRLTGDVAQAVLGCTAAEFLELPPEATAELKWRLLLERCVARIVVLPPTAGRRHPLVSLLALETCDPAEVSQRLPMH